jgi:hypothetical protein
MPFYLLPAVVALLCIGWAPALAQSRNRSSVITPPHGFGPTPGSFDSEPSLGNPDVDDTVAMQIHWRVWSRCVEEAVQERVNQLCNTVLKDDQHLSCDISYVVSCTGLMTNVFIIKASGDLRFDAIVVKSVKSLSHSSMLKFPECSSRQFESRTQTLTWNRVEKPDRVDAPADATEE